MIATKMVCGCEQCEGLNELKTKPHVCVEVGCNKTAMLGDISVGPDTVAKICGDCFGYYQALRGKW